MAWVKPLWGAALAALVLLLNGAAVVPSAVSGDLSPQVAPNDLGADRIVQTAANPYLHRVNLISPDGQDPRRAADANDPIGLRAIVRMVNRQPIPDPSNPQFVIAGDSTGTIISPCFAVGAYHSVFGGSLLPSTEGFDVDVYTLDQNDGQGRPATGSIPSALGRPVIWGSFHESGSPTDDWVLIEMTPCKGETVGWAEFDRVRELPSQRIYRTAGFPVDLAAGTLWIVEDNCQFFAPDFAPMTLRDDCSQVDGNSGGPIGYFDNGLFNVVAIQLGDRRTVTGILKAYDEANPNVSLRVETFRGAIDPYIRPDLARLPNPALNILAPAFPKLVRGRTT